MWCEVWRKPGMSFQESAHSGYSGSNNGLWRHMWKVVYQGSPLETQCPGFLLGPVMWAPSALHLPKFQIPIEARQVSSIHHIVCTSSLGPVNRSYQGRWELSPNPSSQMSGKGHYGLFSDDHSCQMRGGASEGKDTSQQEKEKVGQLRALEWTKRTEA